MAVFHYGSLANGLYLPYAYLTIFTAPGYFCTFLPEAYTVTKTCKAVTLHTVSACIPLCHL